MDSIGKSRGKNIFGLRLHRARKAAGLSLRALGRRTGVSPAAIKNYEGGGVTPVASVLTELALALDVHIEYFFRPRIITLERVEYRKCGPLPKKQLNAITHEVIDQVERRLELESLFPTPPVVQFKKIGNLPESICSLGQIEEIAEDVRQAWGFGCNPIPDLNSALEENGLRVFTVVAAPERKFDGMLAHAGDLPILVVDVSRPGDRQRFTLAHELGHLVLENRLDSGIGVEKACNRFAGAFLFPRESVTREIGARRNSIEMRELALLKKKFGLSMAGILHRVHDIGVVSDAFYKEQTKTFRERGWNLKEPGDDYPAEKAPVHERLVFHALAERYLSMSRAAELMGVPLHELLRIRSPEAHG